MMTLCIALNVRSARPPSDGESHQNVLGDLANEFLERRMCAVCVRLQDIWMEEYGVYFADSEIVVGDWIGVFCRN